MSQVPEKEENGEVRGKHIDTTTITTTTTTTTSQTEKQTHPEPPDGGPDEPLPPPPPYTTFSPQTRWYIISLVGTATLISPLTATIYFPLLPLLAREFGVDLQAITLTVTVYIVVQATAPIVLAGPSDHVGRRPVLLVSFALVTVASLGVAVIEPSSSSSSSSSSSYVALVVLRAVQSLGASAVLSVSNAVVVDICTPVQRGKLLGPLMVTGNLGTAVGPVVGGWIVYASREYRWAFGALVIFAGGILVLLGLFLPETARNVVGDGSVREKWWNRPVWGLVRGVVGKRCGGGGGGGGIEADEGAGAGQSEVVAKHKMSWKSPLASIRVLFYADTSLIIWIGSTYYAAWYCIQASIPIIYENTYRFNELQVGLAYIPGAAGTIVGMYISARMADRFVKQEIVRVGKDYNDMKKNNNQDLSWFPFEKVRTRFCEVLLVTSFAMYAGFGWLVRERVHAAVPLVFQFLIGFVNTYICQVYSVLILDGFSHAPASAATANNVSRYALAAVATAALNPCVEAVGYGWFMSGLGFLTGVLGLCAQTLLRAFGLRWRSRRNSSRSLPS